MCNVLKDLVRLIYGWESKGVKGSRRRGMLNSTLVSSRIVLTYGRATTFFPLCGLKKSGLINSY